MINPLKKGDKITVVSPSATIKDNPETPELIKKGTEILEKMGLTIENAKHWDGKNRYKSGTAEERAADINDAFQNPEIKAIFSTQGGNNSNEILHLLDWDLIKNNPKPFFGSSDITVLLNSMYTRIQNVSYHGIDLMWGLGKNASDYTAQHLEKFLFEGKLEYDKHHDYPAWKNIRNGKAEGVCIGGCIPSFCLLLGTENDPIASISEPFVLIIESIGQTFSTIESNLAQIFQQPNFKKYCAGIIIGYFFLCKEDIPENNINVSDIILEYTKEYEFPVIEIKELGHATENLIFPIGRKIKVVSNDKEISIST